VVQQDAQVAGEPKASGMCFSLAGEEEDIGQEGQLFQSAQDDRGLSEGKQPGDVGKGSGALGDGDPQYVQGLHLDQDSGGS